MSAGGNAGGGPAHGRPAARGPAEGGAQALAAIEAALAGHRLAVMGRFRTEAGDGLPPGRTLVLIGPDEPGYWAELTATPEWRDGGPDPVDRWSRRVIGAIAGTFGAEALYPFGGPPWRPFYAWALRSGRAWASPVGLLVHDRMGLFASYRGAMLLGAPVAPAPAPDGSPSGGGPSGARSPGRSPCDGCPAPCRTACPAAALTAEGYDLAGCHAFLDSGAGAGCMAEGCAVRRACPVSRAYGRLAALSAYHMRQFHP